jgi:hypothetical protein
MAKTATTLSAAVGVNDDRVLLAAITSLAVGDFLLIDAEVMKVLEVPSAATVPVRVLRGQEGSKQTTHVISAKVVRGLASDFATGGVAGAPAITPFPASRQRTISSYSAAGAIAMPTPGSDAVAVLNGTGALAMTLAVPGADQDGDRLTVVGNGKAAHTVTVASGLGNVGATADVITFKADQSQAIDLIACGGFWVNTSLVAGAATVAGAGLA